MNKRIAIPVIAVLAVAVVVVGFFLGQQTSKLGEAESEIVALEGNVATLEGNISTLETELAESEARVSILEADLVTANAKIEDLQADLSTQRNINLALSEELKTVTYPRHFQSLAELVDWLHEDDTDIRYAGEDVVHQSFILQVRALRDGYLLPVALFLRDEEIWVMNTAVIGDEVHGVSAWDDHTEWLGFILPIPSRPIAPD
ncbi:hypothetical protein M1N22_02880 [Dehalococcoidia bacterium]|nr:hypothetical protein [Dehalococcoidia bacterium]